MLQLFLPLSPAFDGTPSAGTFLLQPPSKNKLLQCYFLLASEKQNTGNSVMSCIVQGIKLEECASWGRPQLLMGSGRTLGV
jgi:hypothetical protein